MDVEGDRGGFAPVERVTTDLEPAIGGADVIIIVTGGNAQAAVARSLASLLRPDQVILLIQGNTGGSLIVRRALDDAGCRAEVEVAEMDNYPYSCSDFGNYFSDVKNNTLAGSISAYSPEAGPLRRLIGLIVRAGLVLETVAVMALVLAYFLL